MFVVGHVLSCERMKESSLASRLGVRNGINKMANLERPEVKLMGNVSENFKNFGLHFNNHCIKGNY